MSEENQTQPRPKMNVDIDPVIREALNRRASRLHLERGGKAPPPIYQVVAEILRQALAQEIAEVLARSPEPVDEPPPGAARRGRKRKG